MIIYKTTNLINGKFYVGQDSKNNPEYYGSGNLLKRAIKKHGKQNFIKETLEVCCTQEQLNEREKYWIKETKARELGYNIAEGGTGGNTTTNPSSQANGTSGSTNLGAGGGGAGYVVQRSPTNYPTGGAGGSGVVVLKIPTENYTGITTGSPDVTTSGTDTILKFNASGTYTA